MKKRNLGFSLTEIIIVVGILSVLVTAMVPTLIKYIYRAKVSVDISNGQELGKLTERLLADSDKAFYGFYQTDHRTGTSILVNSDGTVSDYELCIVEWNDLTKGTKGHGEWKVSNSEASDFHNEWVLVMPNKIIPYIKSVKGARDHWAIGYSKAKKNSGVQDLMDVQVWIVEGANTVHWKGGGKWHKVYPDVSVDEYIEKDTKAYYEELEKSN